MAAMNPFVSVLPGRIRLRHPLLRQAAVREALAERLRPLATVESHAATGSLLLRFDPADGELVGRLRSEVAAILPDAPTASAPALPRAGQRGRLKPKWRLNQAAKIGAIASMAVSLAALGSSRKLHARAGQVFLLMAATHIAMHWRRTFK